MSERDLIEGLARLAGPVVPGEDPYGRLMRRHRRSRRAAVAGWSTGAVVAVVAALLGPIGIQAAAPPVLGGPSGSAPVEDHGEPLTPWLRRLIESPVRGGLAADSAFVNELTGLLQQHDVGAVRGGQVKILFAGDVEETRLVLAVRTDGGRQQGIVATAPRGASPQLLNSGDDQRYEPDEPTVHRFALRPLAAYRVGRTTLALAPAGCVIAVADVRADPLTWADAPDGDFALIGKPWAWQRVTCDGTVHFRGQAVAPGTGYRVRDVSAAEIEAGLAGARGEPEAGVAAQHLRTSMEFDTVGPPRLLFMGRPPGTELLTYSVVGSPLDGGWWRLSSWTVPDSGGMSMVTSADVTDPDLVVGVMLDFPNDPSVAQAPRPDAQQRFSMLLLAPRSATTVQVRDRAGKLLDTVALAGGVGTTLQRNDGTYTLRALNAAGAVVGEGTYPLPSEHLPLPDIDDWS